MYNSPSAHRTPASPRCSTPPSSPSSMQLRPVVLFSGLLCRSIVPFRRIQSLFRSSSSSSLYGDSSGQRLSKCTAVATFFSKLFATNFLVAQRSHILVSNPFAPKHADSLPWRSSFADHDLPFLVSYSGSLLTASLKLSQFSQRLIVCGLPSSLTNLACNAMELETSFHALPVAHELDAHAIQPTRLPHVERSSNVHCHRLCPPPCRSVCTNRIPAFPLIPSVPLPFFSSAILPHISWSFETLWSTTTPGSPRSWGSAHRMTANISSGSIHHPRPFRFRLSSFHCEIPHFLPCIEHLNFHLRDRKILV